MKSCPVCKANFNDDNLNFCLNDGATLFSVPDEVETRVIPRARNTNEPTLPNINPVLYNQTAPSSSNKAVFLLVSVLALILLAAIGGIAAYFLIKPAETVSNTKTTPTPKDEDEELKEKIANLEKQLQDQKKTPAPTSTPIDTTTPIKTPTQLNESGKVTARVAQSGDGFLALRTEPNVDTGTRLVKIPSGAIVELEDCQKNYQTISGRRGRWCMVSYNGRVGWVFDAWLIY